MDFTRTYQQSSIISTFDELGRSKNMLAHGNCPTVQGAAPMGVSRCIVFSGWRSDVLDIGIQKGGFGHWEMARLKALVFFNRDISRAMILFNGDNDPKLVDLVGPAV